MIALPRLHHLALTAWHRTLATTTDPYTRGKAEGRVIGLALAMDQLQSDTNRLDHHRRRPDMTDKPTTTSSMQPTTEHMTLGYYRHPSMDGQHPCHECGHVMHEHGWLDTGGAGIAVCPPEMGPFGGQPIVRTVGDLTARHQLTRTRLRVAGREGALKLVKPSYAHPGTLTLIWGDWWENVAPEEPCEVLP